MRSPELISLLWRGWQPLWGVDAAAALAALLYLIAARRGRRRWPARATVAFIAGIACAVVAVQSGIGAYDDRMLSDHMVQHLILLELAPLLLAAGRPVIVLLRTTPPTARPRVARRLRALRPISHPATCLAVFTAVVLASHLPAFYDATVRHPLLHDGEHAIYLAAGLLMWLPVLDGDPVAGRRLDGFSRLAYVIAAMVPMAVIGAYLNRATSLVYPAYAEPARVLGISAVSDQQHAGAIMWVLGSTLMVAAGLWQAMAALVAEERRMTARERRAAAAAGGGRPRG